MKRLWRSASVSFGSRFGLFFVMPSLVSCYRIANESHPHMGVRSIKCDRVAEWLCNFLARRSKSVQFRPRSWGRFRCKRRRNRPDSLQPLMSPEQTLLTCRLYCSARLARAQWANSHDESAPLSPQGKDNCRGSDSIFARRHDRGRLGRLRWPLAASCFVSQPLALHAFKSEIGASNVIDAKLLAVGIAYGPE